VLCVLGVLQIYSATTATKWQDAWWKQIVWVFSGFVMMWIISTMDYHVLMNRVVYL
jgi:rod shape determining protein RodA